MNNYRITYTDEYGEAGSSYITERNEAAARKAYKAIAKRSTITAVDLIGSNVPATKQQERDTLAAIRHMIEELGPQSYIGTALEGCLEIAEQNIDNDFGCSMQQRAEAAEEQIATLKRDLEESRKDYEAAHAAAHEIDKSRKAEIDALKAEIAAIQQPADPSEISDEFVADLIVFSTPYVERIQMALVQNAGQIFKNKTIVGLLHEYATRKEQERLEYARWIKSSIKNGDSYSPSNNCLTHASSYRDVLEDLLKSYWRD